MDNRPVHLSRIFPLRTELRSGLVGWWQMNDNGLGRGASGTGAEWSSAFTAATSVGAKGTLTDGPRWGYSFNSATPTRYVINTAAASGIYVLTSAMSMIVWVNYTVGGTTYIVTQGTGSGQQAFVITTGQGAGQQNLAMWNSGAGEDAFFSTATNDGRWHRCGFARSGTAGNWTIKCYLDGKLDATFTGITNNPNGTGTNMDIGTNESGGSGYNGLMSDLRLYNRTLSAQEFAMDYATSLPSTASFEPELMTTQAPAAAYLERRSLQGNRPGSRGSVGSWAV